jgi:predicted 2-oxoglutarate/Fe(II)-dependent dioxygenase YbiX
MIKNNPKINMFDNIIQNETTRVLSLYNSEFPSMICNRDTGYDLLKYEVGQFHKEHVDQYQDIPNRFLAMSFLMNDDYEGGELAFFNKTYIPKVKKNQVVVFPSNFLYTHQVTPVTKGTRYSIITWAF